MAVESPSVKPVSRSGGHRQAAKSSVSPGAQHPAQTREAAKTPAQVKASGQGASASPQSSPEQDRVQFSDETHGKAGNEELAGSAGIADHLRRAWSGPGVQGAGGSDPSGAARPVEAARQTGEEESAGKAARERTAGSTPADDKDVRRQQIKAELATLSQFIGMLGQSKGSLGGEQLNSLARGAMDTLDGLQRQNDELNGIKRPDRPDEAQDTCPHTRSGVGTYEVAGLGRNKQNVLGALKDAGATKHEQALIMAMGMIETQRMDPSERDRNKDWSGGARNISAFNVNVDLLQRLGVPSSRMDSLNSHEGNANVAKVLLKGMREKGEDWVLNFQRAGSQSLTNPDAHGQAGFRSVIRSIQNDILADPSLLTDNRRLQYSLYGV